MNHDPFDDFPLDVKDFTIETDFLNLNEDTLESTPDTQFEFSEEEFNTIIDQMLKTSANEQTQEQSSKNNEIPEFVKKLFDEFKRTKKISSTFQDLLSGKEIVNINSATEKFTLNPTVAFIWLENLLGLPNSETAFIIFNNTNVRNLFSAKFYTDPTFCVSLLKKAFRYKQKRIAKMMWDSNSKLQDYFSGKEVNLGTIDKPNLQKISFSDCIFNFKSALASQNGSIIKAIWNCNSELQTYFCGKEVNLGTTDKPNFQKISFSDFIANFNSALASHCKEIIKAIWDGNLKLQLYFSGKEVNLGTAEKQNLQKISLSDCIDNFKRALSSNSLDIIKAMWDGNSELKTYFSGKEVNLGTIEKPNLQKISLLDCTDNFKSALASQCKEVIKAIWVGNLELQAYFSGKKFNLGTADKPKFLKISLSDCIDNFKCALSSRSVDIIKAMWDGNSELKTYFSGKEVNLGTIDKPNFQKISLSDCIDNFNSALASHCTEVIKAIWNSNLELQLYFSGKEVNLGTTEKPNLKKISLSDCIVNFKRALSSRSVDIITAMWDGNSVLKIYFSGKEVNLGTTEKQHLKKISLSDCIDNFKSALASHCKEVIKAIWNSNLELQLYFGGKEVNLGTTDIPNLQKISLSDCTDNFKSALASHCEEVIKAIWDGNFELRLYFGGKEVNLGTTDIPNLQKISLSDCTDNLKSALASHCEEVIKAIWDGNFELRLYFSGKEVNLGTTDIPNLQKISLSDCIDNFKRALSSPSIDIIKAIWNNSIKTVLNQLKPKEKITLAKKVLSSSTSRKYDFIQEFLSYMDISSLKNLQVTIKAKEGKKITTYIKNQLDSITDALQKLEKLDKKRTNDNIAPLEEQQTSASQKKLKKNSPDNNDSSSEKFKTSIQFVLQKNSIKNIEKNKISLSCSKRIVTEIQSYIKNNNAYTTSIGIEKFRKKRKIKKNNQVILRPSDNDQYVLYLSDLEAFRKWAFNETNRQQVSNDINVNGMDLMKPPSPLNSYSPSFFPTYLEGEKERELTSSLFSLSYFSPEVKEGNKKRNNLESDNMETDYSSDGP